MTNHNDDHNQLPDSALRAFENYPQITASPDFNRKVLERVLVARTPSRLELLCDRLDEIFARPVLKLVGAASMGAIVALVGTGLLMSLWGVDVPSTQSDSPTTIAARGPSGAMADSLFMQNRPGWPGNGAIPLEMQSEYFAPPKDGMPAPTRHENTAQENADNRSSSCPAVSRSQV